MLKSVVWFAFGNSTRDLTHASAQQGQHLLGCTAGLVRWFFCTPCPPPIEPKSYKMTELITNENGQMNIRVCRILQDKIVFYQCSAFSSLQSHPAFKIDFWTWQHGRTLRPCTYEIPKKNKIMGSHYTVFPGGSRHMICTSHNKLWTHHNRKKR